MQSRVDRHSQRTSEQKQLDDNTNSLTMLITRLQGDADHANDAGRSELDEARIDL